MSSAHRTMVTSSYGEYKEAEISGSLRFKSGDAGGAAKYLLLYGYHRSAVRQRL